MLITLLSFILLIRSDVIEVVGLPNGAYPCFVAEVPGMTESAPINPDFPLLVIENLQYRSASGTGDYFYHFGERRLEWKSGPLKGWQAQVELFDGMPIIRFAATATATLEPRMSIGEWYCTIPEHLLDRFDYLYP
jgi:hypothetical protein